MPSSSPAADGGNSPDALLTDHSTIALLGSTLVMTGEIDTAVIEDWRQHHPAPPVVTVVDTTAVTFINSAGLVYLIAVMKASGPGRLTLRAVHRNVIRPLELMGLDEFFDIVG